MARSAGDLGRDAMGLVSRRAWRRRWRGVKSGAAGAAGDTAQTLAAPFRRRALRHGWRNLKSGMAESAVESAGFLKVLISPRTWGGLLARAWEWLDLPGLGRHLGRRISRAASPREWRRFHERAEAEDWNPRQVVLRTVVILVPLALVVWAVAGAGGREDRRLRVAGTQETEEAVEAAPAEETPGDAKRPSVEQLLQLADAYLAHDRLREAAKAYNEILNVDPANAGARAGLQRVALLAKDVPSAIALAQQRIKEAPRNPEGWSALAQAQVLGGDLAAARKTLDHALQASPNDYALLLNAAAASAQAWDWKQAEALCRRAMQVAPKEANARLLLAAIFLAQGQRERAAGELETLVAQQPDNPAGHEALGRVRLAQARQAEALAAFQQAQALRPSWPLPYIDAGIASIQLASYDQALQQFEKALKLAPESLTAQFGVAQSDELRGNVGRAVQSYEKLLAANPDVQPALNNLAYHYAEQGVNLERALELARRAQALDPTDKHIYDTLGWICHQLGKREEAINHLQKAAWLTPESGVVQYHLGKALLAAGRREEAATAFRAALARNLPPGQREDAQAGLAAAVRN
jgi:tetratricopeptide (TPR) repeat protein